MDAWIVYTKNTIEKKKNNGQIDAAKKYAKDNYNIDIDYVSSHDFSISCEEGKNKIFYQGKEVKELPKIVIFRKYDIYLARQFELLGVKVMNSTQAMIDARNKMKTYQVLASKGINIPKTFYIVSGIKRKYFYYDEVCKFFNSNKLILKYTYGSQGKYVHLITNEEEFNEYVQKYEGICIFQEYIESSFGKDIRCYVIGGKFVGAAIRQSDGNNFRSNLAQGGHALNFDYNEKVVKLAVDASNAFNLDICGVDILFRGNDEYTVCEVNALPGFKSLRATSGKRGDVTLIELINDTLKEL
jgi:RimK family alpha-L-glutamate ligase